MGAVKVLVLLAASLSLVNASQQGQSDAMAHTANPIRKVVNMLGSMAKKVEAEGEKEEELFNKFMCYCKNSGGDLSKSISDAEAKVPSLESSIEEGASKKKQLESDLTKHKADRVSAKEAMAKATAIRNQEAKDYTKEASEDKANLAATGKAIKAIEKGMASALLQSKAATVLQQFVQRRQNMDDTDREQLTAFLSGSQDAPSSGEISGILQAMHDEMSKDISEAEAGEKSNIAAFDELMAAKTKEVKALSKSIEEKISRTGELAVELVQMKGDFSSTSEQLAEDTKFVANLKKTCATKKAEWDDVQAARSDELVALADTIKILNDDDALELFKKTLPSASSFVQVEVSTKEVRKRALAVIRGVHRRPRLDFIAMAIQGKKVGFDTVLRMVDEMVGNLKEEQTNDDTKKQYCAKQFDKAGDKKKDLERSISDVETVIENSNEGIATLNEEIKALSDGIKALDKSVSEATKQRKEENADFTDLMASDGGAKDILGFAKNRLNKFYNPSFYQKPKKVALGQVAEHSKDAASVKAKGGNSVIAMLDTLIRDLEKEMLVAKTEEKNSQADYEQMESDSQEKRSGDVKNLAGKQKTLADVKASLEASTEDKTSATKELMAQGQFISSLHAECDWLLEYFDTRKEARVSEIDALGKAKGVLSGADYSLMQLTSRRFLRRA